MPTVPREAFAKWGPGPERIRQLADDAMRVPPEAQYTKERYLYLSFVYYSRDIELLFIQVLLRFVHRKVIFPKAHSLFPIAHYAILNLREKFYTYGMIQVLLLPCDICQSFFP